MIRYADQHHGDVYRIWNPVTRKIHVTGDIIWFKQMLFKKQLDKKAVAPVAELSVEIISAGDEKNVLIAEI